MLQDILSLTLPIGLADVEEKESKVPQAPRKEEHLSLETCTLLIVPMNLTKHFQPEGLSIVPIKMYLWTLQELTKMREK